MSFYEFGMLWTFGICGAVWVYFFLNAGFVHAKAFVNDTKAKRPWWVEPDGSLAYQSGDAAITLLVFFGIAFIGALAWPLFWVSTIVAGILFGLRKFVRFTKKVDRHEHNRDGKVVYSRHSR